MRNYHEKQYYHRITTLIIEKRRLIGSENTVAAFMKEYT